MRKFDIPEKYRSPIISRIKQIRSEGNNLKGDFSPTKLDFGPVTFFTARHFGFCFGVENAIETVYRIMAENKGKNIYLLSEMIHNPKVNQDLLDMGVRFIQDTKGKTYIPWEEIHSEDIVVIPAFGTTLEIEQILKEKNIPIQKYDTTCPFVGRVWKRSATLGQKDYTIVIHGKKDHEETRATFSHACESGHAIIVQNMEEARQLTSVFQSEDPATTFHQFFKEDSYSDGFDPKVHLDKIGVVNQTTMLATETKAIAEFIREQLADKFEGAELKSFFADTRDTLCYATSDNQQSVYSLLEQPADFAIVVGGYKSANTTHLVELCKEVLPTYFIDGADKILGRSEILSFDIDEKKEKIHSFINKEQVRILITSGASCPDAIVDQVIQTVIGLFDHTKPTDLVLDEMARENHE